ncbi:MAG TPA: hypothetical protein PKA10_08020 [Selenomonadales bacterium]|nr:hypothetical protein [Selenomonadales bacterium]
MDIDNETDGGLSFCDRVKRSCLYYISGFGGCKDSKRPEMSGLAGEKRGLPGGYRQNWERDNFFELEKFYQFR